LCNNKEYCYYKRREDIERVKISKIFLPNAKVATIATHCRTHLFENGNFAAAALR